MPIFECSRCNDLTYSSSLDAAGACVRCGSERHRLLEGGFTEAREGVRVLAEADHATLVYDDPDQIAPFCARYLADGVNAGQHVMAGVQDDIREAISEHLAPDVAVLVDWQDPRDIYGDFDADRIAAAYDAMIAAEPRGTRILAGLCSESAEGVSPEEFDRYEAIAHAIVTERGATAICLYDTRSMPADLLPVSARRHTLRVEGDVARRNEQFEYLPA